MDLVLPGAVSLARALLTLARSEQSGVLHVSSSTERFQIILDVGVVRSLSGGADQPGLPDATQSAGALQYALRNQMRDRIKRILLSKLLEYHFGRQEVRADASWLEVPFGAADLVLFGLRELFAERDVERDLATWTAANLSLSSLGESLVCNATLWPEELAVVELLRHGALLQRIRAVLGTSARGLRFLVALHVLGAVTVGPTRDAQYGLLLRKLRQARQAVGANVLLELPSLATGTDARRALHKLAGRFHPDALGPHAPAELRAASHEVMAALNAAEQQLRGSGIRR